MDRNWSFGRRIFMGFGVIVLLTVVVGVVAANSRFRVIDSNDRLLEVNARGLVAAQRLIVTACRQAPPRDARRLPFAGPDGLRSGDTA